jgi:hypothetical protein
MSRARSLASSLPSSFALAMILSACAARSPEATPATAAAMPAEPIAAATAAPTEPVAAGQAVVATASKTYPDCPIDRFCGNECDNYPFRPTDCNTTTSGPARADIVFSPTNMIMCSGGTYALCFFSGPPEKTGTNSGNNRLPCELSADRDSANCSCQAYTGGVWFVDINSILNLGAWYQAVTMEECGPTGAKCQNLAACGPDGSKCAGSSLKVPSVCAYIQNQDPDNLEVSLMPKADLISTFSLAMANDYSMNPQTDCTQVANPLYAGCMTAPCFYPPGTPDPPPDRTIVQCQCPTYAGPYQVGQTGQQCTILDGKTYVWSASYNPLAGSAGGK